MYRYGFQGQELDDEIKGEGNSVNYKYRMHDPRIGRFFAVDPLAPEYPMLTPYQFSSNRPIDYIELEGLEGVEAPGKVDGNGTFQPDSPDNVDNYILEKGIESFAPKPYALPDDAPSAFVAYRDFVYEQETEYWNGKSPGQKHFTARKNVIFGGIKEYAQEAAKPVAAMYEILAAAGGSGMGSGTRTAMTKIKSAETVAEEVIEKLTPEVLISQSKIIKAKPNAPLKTYSRPGTYETAVKEFNNLEGITDIKIIENSKFQGQTGRLPDGSTVTVRNGSSGNAPGTMSQPTLQINPKAGAKTKIRYDGN